MSKNTSIDSPLSQYLAERDAKGAKRCNAPRVVLWRLPVRLLSGPRSPEPLSASLVANDIPRAFSSRSLPWWRWRDGAVLSLAFVTYLDASGHVAPTRPVVPAPPLLEAVFDNAWHTATHRCDRCGP